MAEGSSGGGANLSDLVKEMVKEMDANEFYARGDMYDEAAEVIKMPATAVAVFFLSKQVVSAGVSFE